MPDELDNILFGGSSAQPQVNDQTSQLDNILFGNNNQEQPEEDSSMSLLGMAQAEKPSPISIVDRIRFSFADDKGREEELKQKFQYVQKLPNGKFTAGNSPDSLAPIDPEGIFNDVLGDLADVVGEIPVLAGQVAGTLGGTAVGNIPGGVVGAGAGAAAGEVAKKIIGKSLGVNKQDFSEMATDAAISGAFGLAGEGLAQGTKLGLQATRRALAPKLVSLLNKGSKTAGESGKLPKHVQVVSKIFRYLADVPEESTQTFYKYGLEEMNNPKWFDKKTVLGLVDDAVKGLNEAEFTLSKEVGTQVDSLISAARKAGKSANIQVDDLFSVAKKQAQDLGVLDDFGKINKKYPNSADLKPVKNLLEELGEFKDGRFVNVGKTINAKKAVQISRSFGQKFENVSGKVKNIFYTVLNGDEAMQVKGIRPRLGELAKSFGLDDYANANLKFAKFSTLLERLNQIDVKNPGKIESFIARLENVKEFSLRDLADLETITGKPFLKDWQLWNAGQDFIGANPNVLRFGAIAAILGGIIPGVKTPKSKGVTLAGALMLGTPAGLRTTIRAYNRMGGILSKKALFDLGKKTAKPVESATGRALVSELLKIKAKKND